MASKLAKSFTLLCTLMFAFSAETYATSCGWGATSIDEVITDKTVVFKGRPIYYSQRTKPASPNGWSTVFKIDEVYKGDIGDYGQYGKIYHNSRISSIGLPFQIEDAYFIVAQTQENGDLVTHVGLCGIGFGKYDILEYIKTGNPNNAVPIGCEQDIRIAIKSEFLEGKLSLYEKKCLRYVPAFKRKYPEFVKKYARKK